ncbi:MAG: diphthine--ammonia ligase [Candidatus Methanomethylicia archaeon]|nr:diphthine--ammonia ligase [Candidatus Methanomethylicia archaeon]MCX8169252.1 diphthine--ammonia ligase [Candidatus Methanomethylicia archaeon]MDW7988966.1 diphthine--ammonia ligase [Nitrososphaerota archaeon]
MNNINVAALFSGGKDSTFSIYYAINQGFDVKCLITIEPIEDSMYWHYPNIKWVNLQSKAMEIPYIKIFENYENLVEILKFVKKEFDVNGLLSGVIYSDFQKDFLIRVCRKVGLKLFTPLWMKDPFRLLKIIVNCGIHSIIVLVAAYGLDENWLGREINTETINDLLTKSRKYGISVCGEGGEYETFVYDAPFFKKRILLKDFEKRWFGDRGILHIKSAELICK